MWALRSLRRNLPKAASSSLHRRCAPSISSEGFAARGGGGEAAAASISGALVPVPAGGAAEGMLSADVDEQGEEHAEQGGEADGEETGRTQTELRRAVKLRKKLMTEDERLIHSMRRAKKKVALLLQKLKKYELPDLPAPRHDPELLTAEQLQAYKKIDSKQKLCPCWSSGVFGGINPEDPVAMASIQRVASTFFRAIDEQQGTPYVFHGDNQPATGTTELKEPHEEPAEDSDQEELDNFIAEIEDAAEKQWEEEEAAEKEETSRLQYRYREEMMGERRGFNRSYDNSDADDRTQGRYRRDNDNNKWTKDTRRWDDDSEVEASGEDVDERRGFGRGHNNSDAEDISPGRSRRENKNNRKTTGSRRLDDDTEASGEDWDSDDGRDSIAGFNKERHVPDEHPRQFESMRHERSSSSHRQNYMPGASRSPSRTPKKNAVSVSDVSEDDVSDSEDDEVWGSDYKEETNSVWGADYKEETSPSAPKVNFPNYKSSSEEEDAGDNWMHGGRTGQTKKNTDEDWDSD
ncbi:hypothetical protein ZWY2020_040993 [Hordeum vulgare]|nr:hypothetical protein ZWY2020_040993 [Hordeum vulgare]